MPKFRYVKRPRGGRQASPRPRPPRTSSRRARGRALPRPCARCRLVPRVRPRAPSRCVLAPPRPRPSRCMRAGRGRACLCALPSGVPCSPPRPQPLRARVARCHRRGGCVWCPVFAPASPAVACSGWQRWRAGAGVARVGLACCCVRPRAVGALAPARPPSPPAGVPPAARRMGCGGLHF